MVFFLGRWNGRWFLRRNHCSQWFSEGFLQFNHCCQLFFQAWTIGINGFSMVFDHRTIAIESMVLQSTIGDDGFSMVNEKKRQWFSKIAIYDKKLLLEFKLPTQIEIAQSYQEHHALLPHAMWKYIFIYIYIGFGLGEETNLIYFINMMVSLFNLPRQGVFGLWLLPLWNINGFQGHHCHWMNGLEETIGTNGFSMVFGLSTIGPDVFLVWQPLGSMVLRWFLVWQPLDSMVFQW